MQRYFAKAVVDKERAAFEFICHVNGKLKSEVYHKGTKIGIIENEYTPKGFKFRFKRKGQPWRSSWQEAYAEIISLNNLKVPFAVK